MGHYKEIEDIKRQRNIRMEDDWYMAMCSAAEKLSKKTNTKISFSKLIRLLGDEYLKYPEKFTDLNDTK